MDTSGLKMESNGAYEASWPKWTSCLHTCPSAEEHAASGIHRDGEMSPKLSVLCLDLVSALCLDEVCLDRRLHVSIKRLLSYAESNSFLRHSVSFVLRFK